MHQTESPITPPSRQLIWVALLVVVGIAWIVGQYFWWQEYAFPYGPQIGYEAAKFGRSMANDDWSDVYSHITFCRYYPPLYEMLLGATHAVLGFQLHNTLLLNIVFAFFTALAMYLLTRKLADDYAAAMAVLLFLSHGMVFALVRIPVREVAIMACTAWILLLLHNRKLLWHPVYTTLFTVVYAFGMLIKWTFPLYTLVPALIIFIMLIHHAFTHDSRGRFRAVFLSLFCLLLGFAILAPWYLGVLDLKYLWASTANDPTPGGPFFRLMYYFHVLGMGSVIGNWSTYILLLLSLPAIVFYRRRALLPAASLLSGLFFLFVIVHKESRYVLGSIPPLMMLAGMACSLLPRKWWLRLALFVLVAAAGVYNYVNISFTAPLLPHSSGDLSPLPAAHCLQQGRQSTEQIIDYAAAISHDDKRTVLAWHPLAANKLPFNHDLFDMMIWMGETEDKVWFSGYDLIQYSLFVKKFDEIELLIVTDDVWTNPDEEIQEQMEAWLAFSSSDWEVKEEVPERPRRRQEIEAAFDEVKTFPSECFPTVHLYRKKQTTPDESEVN